MQKNSSVYTGIGMLIYLIVSIIDRFIIRIVDYIYIPIMIIAIIFVIIGILKIRKHK